MCPNAALGQRFGDLFPLPFFPAVEPHSTVLARASSQRLARKSRVVEACNESVWSLNSLSGHDSPHVSQFLHNNSAQDRSLAYIHSLHSPDKVVGLERDEASLKSMLKTAGGYSCSAGVLGSYRADSISLPYDQGEPRRVESMLDDEIIPYIDDFENRMLLNSSELGAVFQNTETPGCHVDPILEHDPKQYAGFVAQMYRSKLVCFDVVPVCSCGLFLVTKKPKADGTVKLRLVIDARRSNRLFKKPPWCPLSSGESLARMEISGACYTAQEDVKDFFYRLGIGKRMSRYFGLPRVRASLLVAALGVDCPAEILALPSDHMVAPCLSVLPMGFSWAFWIAQQVHVHIATMTLGSEGLLVDRAPPPQIHTNEQQAHMIYADNASQFGMDPDVVNERRHKLSIALNGRGLDTHEIIDATLLAETLGIQYIGNPPTVSCTPLRRWKMHRVLGLLIRGRRVSGKDLEIVIGNLTFLFLMNRPLLACLNHCYDFMAACYTERRVLWKSVRHELRIARGLLIFARSDLDRPWHPAALMLDASLSGYSVAEREKDYALVQSVGEWDERWRFRRELDVGARARFVEAESSTMASVRPSVAGPLRGSALLEETFPELPEEFVDNEKWHTLWSAPLFSSDAIHLKEAHGLMSAVRHRSRDANCHSRRHLIASDSMCCVLSFSKGRCVSRPLLRYCQRVAAEVLASNMRIGYRWVISERNFADTGSRLWEKFRHPDSRSSDAALYARAPASAGRRVARPAVPDWAADRAQVRIASSYRGPGVASDTRPQKKASRGPDPEQYFIGSPQRRGSLEHGGDEASSSASPESGRPHSPLDESWFGPAQSLASPSTIGGEEDWEQEGTRPPSAEAARGPSSRVCRHDGSLASTLDGRVRVGLQEEGRHALGLHEQAWPVRTATSALGRGPVGLRGLGLPQRGEGGTRRQAEGSAGCVVPFAHAAGQVGPSPVRPVTSRVAPRGSDFCKDWLPRRRELRHLGSAHADGEVQRGSTQRDVLQHVSSPVVRARPPHMRPDPAPSGRRQCVGNALDSTGGTNRARRGDQDRGLRHGSGARRHARARAGAHASGSGPADASRSSVDREGRGRADSTVGVHGKVVRGKLARGSGRPGVAADLHNSIPGPARRSVARHPVPPSDRSRGSSKRLVEDSGKRSKLRQAIQDEQSRASGWKVDSRVRRVCASSLQASHPKWHRGSAAATASATASAPTCFVGEACCVSPAAGAAASLLSGKSLLSLYGGVGHCCQAVAEYGGDAALVDLSSHSKNDLSNRRVAAEVGNICDTFDCLGIDICCNSWSRARRAPPWSSMPSALRSNDHLMGLPSLNERDKNLVSKHNFLYRRAIEYATRSIQANKSGWIENPLTSMLWKTRGIQKLLRLGARFVETHFCQYGCSYKKATRFIVWGPKSGDVVFSKCTGKMGFAVGLVNDTLS